MLGKLVMCETMPCLVMEGYVAQRYPMKFLFLNNIRIATFFLTLMNTIELHSWCSVRVEKEGIKIVEKRIGSVWRVC